MWGLFRERAGCHLPAANCFSPPSQKWAVRVLDCMVVPSLAAIQRPPPALLRPAETSLVSAVSLGAESEGSVHLRVLFSSPAPPDSDVLLLSACRSGEGRRGSRALGRAAGPPALLGDLGQRSASLASVTPSATRRANAPHRGHPPWGGRAAVRRPAETPRSKLGPSEGFLSLDC